MHNTLSQPSQSRDRKIISRLCGYSSFTLLLWIPFYLLIFYINRIIQYVLFCIFHSASWMILEFNQVVDYICGVHCFLLLNIILLYGSVQFSHSVLSDSFHPIDCSRPGLPVHFHSQSLLKLMSVELEMPFNHLILCCPLLLLPSIFPSIRIFSSELILCIRWPKYWSVSISPSNE